MTGRYHLSITLPGGERVTADYREAITMVMQRAATGDPEPSDLAAILAWYQANIQTVTACQRQECDHFV